MNLKGIKQSSVLVALSFLVGLLASCSPSTGYETSEDCALDNVADAKTDSAVLVIQQACQKKFPEPPATKAESKAAAVHMAQAKRDAQAAANAAAAAAIKDSND